MPIGIFTGNIQPHLAVDWCNLKVIVKTKLVPRAVISAGVQHIFSTQSGSLIRFNEAVKLCFLGGRCI